MGLNYPADLAEWHRWQNSQNPIRRIKGTLRKPDESALFLSVRGEFPQILVVLDAAKPTSIAAYMLPLKFLPDTSVAVLAPADVARMLPGNGWKTQQVPPDPGIPEPIRGVSVVLAAGNYLPAGAAAHRWSVSLGARFMVVQHGLVTPHAPPLPAGCHLLAFSAADATYWSAGRQDLTFNAVGSQLLWQAAQQQTPSQGRDERPVFLGQLHGAELPRQGLARAATSFCISTRATYRPHPSETDKLSRLQHKWWQKRGIRIDRSSVPLTDLTAPIVSVFSTGVLEAAARGIPSWVTYADPPAWLEEFWERYAMSRWGAEPTPAPTQPGHEPAAAIAQILKEHIGVAP